MPKMFKLLENELGLLHSSYSKTFVFAKNIETFADYILEDDDKNNYTKDMINIVEKISQSIFQMSERIKIEQEYIEKIKKEIIELY